MDAFFSLAAACTAVKQQVCDVLDALACGARGLTFGQLQSHGSPSMVGVCIPPTLDSTLAAFVSQVCKAVVGSALHHLH